LRAIVSLSRLWQAQGQREQAYRILAEMYGWFAKGFETVDLQEAKALLSCTRWAIPAPAIEQPHALRSRMILLR
jgi:hypothetical protein